MVRRLRLGRRWAMRPPVKILNKLSILNKQAKACCTCYFWVAKVTKTTGRVASLTLALIQNKLARELLRNRLPAYFFVRQPSRPSPPLFNNVKSGRLLMPGPKDQIHLFTRVPE